LIEQSLQPWLLISEIRVQGVRVDLLHRSANGVWSCERSERTIHTRLPGGFLPNLSFLGGSDTRRTIPVFHVRSEFFTVGESDTFHGFSQVVGDPILFVAVAFFFRPTTTHDALHRLVAIVRSEHRQARACGDHRTTDDSSPAGDHHDGAPRSLQALASLRL
jgi:hypothetical protein